MQTSGSGPVYRAFALKAMLAKSVSAHAFFPLYGAIATFLRGSDGCSQGMSHGVHGEDVVFPQLVGHVLRNGIGLNAEFSSSEIVLHDLRE